jgi:hypothetical protein
VHEEDARAVLDEDNILDGKWVDVKPHFDAEGQQDADPPPTQPPVQLTPAKQFDFQHHLFPTMAEAGGAVRQGGAGDARDEQGPCVMASLCRLCPNNPDKTRHDAAIVPAMSPTANATNQQMVVTALRAIIQTQGAPDDEGAMTMRAPALFSELHGTLPNARELMDAKPKAFVSTFGQGLLEWREINGGGTCEVAAVGQELDLHPSDQGAKTAKVEWLTVCQTCFRVTSHRSAADQKIVLQENSARCIAQHHVWGLQVAKLAGDSSSAWSEIRAQPAAIGIGSKVMRCHSGSCNFGAKCTYAHSDVELYVWQSAIDARSANTEYTGGFARPKMCFSVEAKQACRWNACPFAHTEHQLEAFTEQWSKNASKDATKKARSVGPSQRYFESRDGAVPVPGSCDAELLGTILMMIDSSPTKSCDFGQLGGVISQPYHALRAGLAAHGGIRKFVELQQAHLLVIVDPDRKEMDRVVSKYGTGKICSTQSKATAPSEEGPTLPCRQECPWADSCDFAECPYAHTTTGCAECPPASGVPIEGQLAGQVVGTSEPCSTSSAELCGICTEQSAIEELRPCGHRLCTGCLAAWRDQTSTKEHQTGTRCPFCREPILGNASATCGDNAASDGSEMGHAWAVVELASTTIPAVAKAKDTTKALHELTVADVCSLLLSCNLGKYASAFEDCPVDGATLGECEDTDLQELGMGFAPHRRKLLTVIAGLKTAGSGSSSSDAALRTPTAPTPAVALSASSLAAPAASMKEDRSPGEWD